MLGSTHNTPGAQPARLDRFIRLTEVKRITGFSTTTVYERMARGEFPKQICCGGRSVAWLESDLIAWQQNILKNKNN